MEDRIRAELLAASQLLASSITLAPEINRAARVLGGALARGGRIFFCGNGGSAADAQHLAAELVVRLRPDSTRRPLAGIALTTDSSVLTACANDFGFEQVFSRQLTALAARGDILFAMSTSGSSPNIIQAVQTAAKLFIPVVLLTGDTNLPDSIHPEVRIRVPSRECTRIQEMHIIIGHLLIALTEDYLHNGI